MYLKHKTECLIQLLLHSFFMWVLTVYLSSIWNSSTVWRDYKTVNKSPPSFWCLPHWHFPISGWSDFQGFSTKVPSFIPLNYQGKVKLIGKNRGNVTWKLDEWKIFNIYNKNISKKFKPSEKITLTLYTRNTICTQLFCFISSVLN